MAQIAGLSDSRKHGPPADIGTFQFAATALVFQHTFSGVSYYCTIISGVGGWVLLYHGDTLSAAIQSAIDSGTQKIYLNLGGTHTCSPSVNVNLEGVELVGPGKGLVLQMESTATQAAYNMFIVTVDNVAFKDLYFDGNRANVTYGAWDLTCCISIEGTSLRTLITGCHFIEGESHFIIERSTMTGGMTMVVACTFKNCDTWGVAFAGSGDVGSIMMGCHCESASPEVWHTGFCVFTGNTFYNAQNLYPLLIAAECADNVVIGNTFYGDTGYAIEILTDATDNTVTGNRIINVFWCGILVKGPDNLVSDNHITGDFTGIECRTADNDLLDNKIGCTTGINLTAASSGNRVFGNDLRGSTTLITDAGTDNIYECIPLYIASYNVTDISESEDGLVVDAGGEWVSFVGQLPPKVQQVMKFEIWAVGLAAPGAGNQMCLEIEIEGGADDEPKTQHDTGALAGQLNTTEATAVDDIIHWVCTHANALALLGGDSVKCACRHNAAVAADIATNAAFRRVLAHIV